MSAETLKKRVEDIRISIQNKLDEEKSLKEENVEHFNTLIETLRKETKIFDECEEVDDDDIEALVLGLFGDEYNLCLQGRERSGNHFLPSVSFYVGVTSEVAFRLDPEEGTVEWGIF